MRVKSSFLVFVFLVALVIEATSQCSMCRLMAESSYQGGSEIGRGINDGISYIMGIPYLLLLIGGYVLFKKNMSK
ncbi:MAG: hypothetical protein KDC83_11315 [Flavobacteriales bacterium]|nr:hypothetical protein [Flavobacteriales bacterium]